MQNLRTCKVLLDGKKVFGDLMSGNCTFPPIWIKTTRLEKIDSHSGLPWILMTWTWLKRRTNVSLQFYELAILAHARHDGHFNWLWRPLFHSICCRLMFHTKRAQSKTADHYISNCLLRRRRRWATTDHPQLLHSGLPQPRFPFVVIATLERRTLGGVIIRLVTDCTNASEQLLLLNLFHHVT